jgi:hypothetical protein
VGREAGILHALGELERALDVLAGGLVVALTPVAPRPPVEDPRLQLVGRQLGALSERVCLIQQTECGRDARQLVAAHAETEQHFRALEVGEPLVLADLASAEQDLNRAANVTGLGARTRLADEGAELELGRAGGRDLGPHALEGLDSLARPAGHYQRIAPRKRGIETVSLGGREPAAEEAGIDAEPRGEPRHRRLCRPRLAALDLADVLLREPLAGELGLGQAGREAQLAKPDAEVVCGRPRPGASAGSCRTKHRP